MGRPARPGFTEPHSAPPLPPRPKYSFFPSLSLSPLLPPPSVSPSFTPSLWLWLRLQLPPYLPPFATPHPITPSPTIAGGGESCFFTPLQNSGLGPRAESHLPSSWCLCSVPHRLFLHILNSNPQSPSLGPGSGQRGSWWPPHTHIPHLQGHVNLQGLFWEPPPGICKGAGAGLSLHRTHPPPLRGWASVPFPKGLWRGCCWGHRLRRR